MIYSISVQYRVILADPPWSYSDRQRHRPDNYPRVAPAELRTLNVHGLAAEDAALFIWSTGPMLQQALSLFRWWGGFRYVTPAFVWTKTTKDGGGPRNTQGHYSLPNTEYCLLGVRGRPKVVGHPWQEVREPPREHSRKPDCVRDRIVQMFGDVSRIELFARGAVPDGWDAHGNQAVNPVEIP